MTTYRYIYGKLELISSKCGKTQVTLYKGDYGETSERKQESQLNATPSSSSRGGLLGSWGTMG